MTPPSDQGILNVVHQLVTWVQKNGLSFEDVVRNKPAAQGVAFQWLHNKDSSEYAYYLQCLRDRGVLPPLLPTSAATSTSAAVAAPPSVSSQSSPQAVPDPGPTAVVPPWLRNKQTVVSQIPAVSPTVITSPPPELLSHESRARSRSPRRRSRSRSRSPACERADCDPTSADSIAKMDAYLELLKSQEEQIGESSQRLDCEKPEIPTFQSMTRYEDELRKQRRNRHGPKIAEQNVGFQLLQKLGWQQGEGVGKTQGSSSFSAPQGQRGSQGIGSVKRR